MPTRPLNYRLRQQAVLFSDDTADISWQGDTWPAADPDEQVPIYVVLSLNELVRLASSVDVGSDIAYEDAVGLQYLFNRVFQVDQFCNAVADCISSSPAVQQAINNTTNATTNLINRTTNYSNQTLITGAGDDNGCGNDAKFGRIVALIDFIDTVMQDFFEAFDSATNVLGQLDELISAVPLFETLPIDEAIGAIGNTGELWQDSYEGSVNTQLKESFACNIWCTYGDSCDLVVSDVLALILERYNLTTTQGQLNVLSLGALLFRVGTTVAAAGGVAYVGDEFVYLSWMLQLAAIELTGSFFGVDPIDYVSAASNGSPNTSWSLCACDSCEDTDFANGQQGWVARVRNGAADATWVGDGWIRGDVGTNGQDEITIIRQQPQPNVIASIEVTYVNYSDPGRAGKLRVEDGGSNTSQVNIGQNSSDTVLFDNLNWPNAADVVVRLFSEPQSGAMDSGKITRVVICYA